MKQYAEPDCIILLVGNKLDLVESNNKKRQVINVEAMSFAEENKLIFYETSALANVKVSEAFDTLINGILNVIIEINTIRIANNNTNLSNTSLGNNSTYGNFVRLSTKKIETEEEGKCCARFY